ncbi:prostaglandin D2 receptor 2-like [Nothobranchius furzeri]|uniref:Prostaglandin D2 receptor 2-like n=3 Tax=Nothobranchius furzeri TaxID=105023 RepID=A0A9D2YAJ7_NOTFU|nr:prostaglandin D2 receptor 2-like [Nothobranchius furzeri]
MSAMTQNYVNATIYCPLIEVVRNNNQTNDNANALVVCFHGIFSAIGIFENAFIIWMLGFRLKRCNTASVWVLNLALSDFLATLTLPLFTVYFYNDNSWELGEPLCKMQSSIFYLNMFFSAFLLAVISLDRLLLLATPLWSRHHRSVSGAWKVCALGWLWAALNTTPYSLFRAVIEKEGEHKKKLCYHNFALFLSSDETLERDCNVRQASTAISKTLLAFIIPLVIITGSYIVVTFKLREMGKRKRQSTRRFSEMNLNDVKESGEKYLSATKLRSSSTPPNTPAPLGIPKSFSRMVKILIAAFALIWAPYHIACMLEMMADAGNASRVVDKWLPGAATFSFLNPLLNPVLYAFSCPQFCVRIRQSLASVFEGLLQEELGGCKDPGNSNRI